MSNYIKSTDFAGKDALNSGDAAKIVKGTEIGAEFDALQTAVNSKANASNAALTGTPTAPTAAPGTSSTQVATTAFFANLYPVGSVYINAGVGTNPFTLFGFGTWVPLGEGRVLLGAGAGYTGGAVGGSANASVVSHTHTGTVDTGGAHTHTTLFGFSNDVDYFGNGVNILGPNGAGVTSQNYPMTTGAGQGTHNHTFTTNSSGSSGTNANLQPYLVVYMWQRTV